MDTGLDKLRKTRATWAVPLGIFSLWIVVMATLLYVSSAFGDHHILLKARLLKWDGGWYQDIIAHGYHFIACKQSNVAFFPLYPLLATGVAHLGITTGVAGMITSLACFAGALFVTYKLVAQRFDATIARITCLFLAFFPTSFFFGLVYTESLFLLLVALTLWFTSRKQWWLAAVMVGLAGSTRVVGVLLAIVAIGGYIENWKPRTITPARVATIMGLGAISVSGLLAFMAYLRHISGDWLAFLHVQQYWPGRGGGIHGLSVTAHHLLTFRAFSNPYALNVTEVAAIVLFLGLAVVCWLKVNKWWSLFSVAAIIIPLLSGSTISMDRYVLVLLPCFIAAAALLKTPERALYVLIPSAMLLAFYFNLYLTSTIFLG
jgi:hypothetical protein